VPNWGEGRAQEMKIYTLKFKGAYGKRNESNAERKHMTFRCKKGQMMKSNKAKYSRV
jgi:hypothetical protein